MSDEYEYTCRSWFSEWDKQTYYNCLLKRNGQVIWHKPNAYSPITKQTAIKLYKAKEIRK